MEGAVGGLLPRKERPSSALSSTVDKGDVRARDRKAGGMPDTLFASWQTLTPAGSSQHSLPNRAKLLGAKREP
jgi:hypothetical protein